MRVADLADDGFGQVRRVQSDRAHRFGHPVRRYPGDVGGVEQVAGGARHQHGLVRLGGQRLAGRDEPGAQIGQIRAEDLSRPDRRPGADRPGHHDDPVEHGADFRDQHQVTDGPRVTAPARPDADHSVYAGLDRLLGEPQRGDVVQYQATPVVDPLGQFGRVALRRDDDLNAVARAQFEVGRQLRPRRTWWQG